MRSSLPLLGLALLSLACGETAGPDPHQLTVQEVVTITQIMLDVDFDITTAAVLSDAPADPGVDTDPVTTVSQVALVHPCPEGGEILFEGESQRTWDADSQTGTADVVLTKVHDDCIRTHEDVTLALSGSPSLTVTAHHDFAEGQRRGIQSVNVEGSFSYAVEDGRQGTCDVEIATVYHVDTGRRITTARLCGRSFGFNTEWTPDPA